MPYAIKKNVDGTYKVISVESGTIHSKHTTKEKALKQVRLLQAIEHGFIPTGEREDEKKEKEKKNK